MFSSFPDEFTGHSPFTGKLRISRTGAYLMFMPSGTPLFLLASAFFRWLAAADAYPVLDRHTASLAWFTSTGLAHRNLLGKIGMDLPINLGSISCAKVSGVSMATFRDQTVQIPPRDAP
jgi:hypothetical protein